MHLECMFQMHDAEMRKHPESRDTPDASLVAKRDPPVAQAILFFKPTGDEIGAAL